MSKPLTTLSILLLSIITACGVDSLVDRSSGSTILDIDCAQDSDCPAGYECEIEEEHGVTTTFCKLHSSDDGSGAGSGSGTDGGVGGGTLECETDADCGPGLECEIEEEHGTTSSFCKPHGGV